MIESKEDRLIGWDQMIGMMIESKEDRLIEMVKNGVVCHSMGHHAACSDECVMGLGLKIFD
jgi:predicted Zn-dependent protease with MMP-like domain